MNMESSTQVINHYDIPMHSIKLVREKTASYGEIRYGEDVVKLLQPMMQDLDREVFNVVALNTRNEIIGVNTCSLGSINTAQVFMSSIVKYLLLTNAASCIVAHNHPSGNTAPSLEDDALTEGIRKACSFFDIELLDHIIVGFPNYYSYAKEGRLTHSEKVTEALGAIA